MPSCVPARPWCSCIQPWCSRGRGWCAASSANCCIAWSATGCARSAGRWRSITDGSRSAALTESALGAGTSMSGFRAFLRCLVYVVPAALSVLGLPPRDDDLGPGMPVIFGMRVLLGGALLQLVAALARSRERADGEVAGAMEADVPIECA